MSPRVLAQAFGGLAFLVAAMAAAVLLSAGTLAYWQAWLALSLFGGSTLLITLYLVRADAALLERRVAAGPTAEKDPRQQRIQALAQVAFLAELVVPGLDHRFGWSRVPDALVFAGDAAIVAGLAVVFLVFRENSFASATVEVAEGQRVIATGPYAAVRHPMYSGALLLLVGLPIALGSWLGLGATAVMAAVLVWRLREEERFLRASLTGYVEYCSRVRWRLVPGIF